MSADPTLTHTMVRTIAQMAARVPVEDAKALVREIERTDALLPFVDPTAYMRLRATAGGHPDMARAFLAFRRELEALRPVAEVVEG